MAISRETSRMQSAITLESSLYLKPEASCNPVKFIFLFILYQLSSSWLSVYTQTWSLMSCLCSCEGMPMLSDACVPNCWLPNLPTKLFQFVFLRRAGNDARIKCLLVRIAFQKTLWLELTPVMASGLTVLGWAWMAILKVEKQRLLPGEGAKFRRISFRILVEKASLSLYVIACPKVTDT